MSSPAGVEKCFEEAQDSGVLKVCHKGLKCFPNFVDEYDLLDVLNVDISKNRFVELPQEVLSFVMMEKLVASHNFLKTLPDLSNLNALTYLDISQNQMQTIPVHTCSLPLKILKASHNKITVIPCEIGLLSKLQSLDISCNELTNLPSTLGDLTSLRMLNVRRNVIVSLPDELSKLKNLCNLNFSCNRISNIPPAFRLISSLIELDLTNNPLSSPPAQICLKGRLHIVKFLSMAAQQQEKRWSTMLKDKANRSPSTNSLTTTNNDSEKHMTDKQLGNEVHDIMANGAIKEMDVLSDTLEKELVDSPTRSDSFTHKSELPRKPEGLTLQENREKQRILQEKGKLTPQFKTRMPTPTFPTTDNQMVTSPTQGTMSLDRNVGRQVGSQVKSKDSNEKLRSESLTEEESPGDKPELSSPNSTSSHTSSDSNQAGEVVFEGIAKRGSLKQRNNKILKDGASNYTMRRFYDVAKEEFEKLEKLRE
uniref:Disease resistance R13L4/SHOC-2-like LRR domain-containing protein n=1 Tax=Clytia hemisphaerica TaxID=252671 RepID=A0A7M5XMF5_9CNID